MNTNPDEETLALWLDDELVGDGLAAVEIWANAHPEQLAAREEIRNWRKTVSAAIPATAELPFPDFFNSRVLKSIRDSAVVTSVPAHGPSSWTRWFMPAAALGGMALAFWVGTISQSKVEGFDVTGAPKALPVESLVYIPETGVDAELFNSSNGSATVIVLSGVADIPDDAEFLETGYLPSQRDSFSTAGGPDLLKESMIR